MLKKRIRAFTLVELLVVIAIIGILIALLLPAVQAAREAARRSQCTNNIKQLVLGTHNYHDISKTFPPGSVAYTQGGGVPGIGSLNQSWITRVLPFIEQGPMYEKLDMESSGTLWTDTQPGTWQAETVLSIVLCPSDENKPIQSTHAPTNYVACTGADERFVRHTGGTSDSNGLRQILNSGVWKRSQWHSIADIKDGTSNTMSISEIMLGNPPASNEGDWQGVQNCMAGNSSASPRSYARGWSWYAAKYPHSWGFNTLLPPNDKVTADYECEDGNKGSHCAMTARSYHPGGVNVGMADGTVKFVSETVDLFLWRAASTIRGKEAQNLP